MRHNRTTLLLASLLIGASACGGGPRPTTVDVPRRGEAGILVTPASASVAEEVSIRAWGFEPADTIVIGFGPPQAEYEVLREVVTDSTGTAWASISVPDWAEEGRSYVWVAADRDNDPRAVSEPFTIRRRS